MLATYFYLLNHSSKGFFVMLLDFSLIDSTYPLHTFPLLPPPLWVLVHLPGFLSFHYPQCSLRMLEKVEFFILFLIHNKSQIIFWVGYHDISHPTWWRIRALKLPKMYACCLRPESLFEYLNPLNVFKYHGGNLIFRNKIDL